MLVKVKERQWLEKRKKQNCSLLELYFEGKWLIFSLLVLKHFPQLQKKEHYHWGKGWLDVLFVTGIRILWFWLVTASFKIWEPRLSQEYIWAFSGWGVCLFIFFLTQFQELDSNNHRQLCSPFVLMSRAFHTIPINSLNSFSCIMGFYFHQ